MLVDGMEANTHIFCGMIGEDKVRGQWEKVEAAGI